MDPPEFGAIVGISIDRTETPSPDPRVDESDPFATASPRRCFVEPNTILAVVGHTEMVSLDSTRRPSALGYDSDAELRRQQPQIFELIATEFTGLFISHSDETGMLQYHIPPTPPRLHDRVRLCDASATAAATADLRFMRRILRGDMPQAPSEELCAAIVRRGFRARNGDAEYLTDAARQIAEIVGADYDRLRRILAASME
jgi:hypothetical protein